MIISFKCKETQLIWEGEMSRRLPHQIQNRALRKLSQIDASLCINDLKVPPGNHLEELRGNREGLHSIRVNNQWRICFRWHGSDAYDVEIVDYH